MSERGKNYSLRERVKTRELRRQLSLKMSSIRANPDCLWRELCSAYALGFSDGWDCHEADGADTIPPASAPDRLD